MTIDRHTRFNEIPNLDKELNSILKQIGDQSGNIVTALPPVGQQKELTVFHVKNTSGDYENFKKIGSAYHILKKDASDNVVWSPI